VGTLEGFGLMAGIGSAVIGTEVIGAAGDTLTSRYQWVLTIDWGGVSTPESARLLSGNVDRGSSQYTNGSGDGLNDTPPGKLSIVLDNYDKRYDPRNASSPLYPNVTNLTSISLAVNDTTGGTQYPVFAGTIEDIRESGGPDAVVTVSAYDDLETLRQQTATTPLSFNITADAAIQLIATATGISGGIYEASSHPLTVFALENDNALQAATDITEASLGQLFVDRSGRLRYYSLSYSGMATHAIDEDTVDKNIRLSQPWDERYPYAAVYANRWARTASKVLWDYGGAFTIPSGSSRTVRAEWQQIAAVGPLKYSRNPYVSTPGVMTNALSAVISNITARSADITVTNVSPWPQGTKLQLLGIEYMTGITISDRRYQPGAKVKGQTAATVSTKQLYSAEDTTLAAKRRSRFVLDSEYIHDGNYAAAYAVLLKDHLKSGLQTITITFSTPDSMAQQFGIELYDLVEFTAPSLNIDGDYYLGAVSHQWNEGRPGEVRTEMTLVQLLKSGASITQEPIIDVPELEPDPDQDNNGNPVLPPPVNGGCVYNTAPANGPFAVGIAGQFNTLDLNAAVASFPCIIRPPGFTNQTAYSFRATRPAGSSAFGISLTVYGLDKTGTAIASSTPTLTGDLYTGTFSGIGTITTIEYLAVVLGSGDRFLANPNFDSDIAGWTFSNTTESWQSAFEGADGVAKMVNDSAVSRSGISQSLTLDPGDYTVTYRLNNETNPGDGFLLEAFVGGSSQGQTTVTGDGWIAPVYSFSVAAQSVCSIDATVLPAGSIGTVTGYVDSINILATPITLGDFTISNVCPVA
jgi:hypothetical protein